MTFTEKTLDDGTLDTDSGVSDSVPDTSVDTDAGSVSGFTHLNIERTTNMPPIHQLVAYGLITFFLAGMLGQIAWASSYLFESQFRARTEIQYRGTAWTETQDVQVQSRSLTAPIAAALGLDIKDFEEDLDAGLVPGTQILRIDFVSTDAEEAKQIVGRLGEDYKAQVDEAPEQEVRNRLEEELTALQGDLGAAEERLRESASLSAQLGEDNQAIFREEGLDQLESEQQALRRLEQQTTQSLINNLRARIGGLELRLLDDEIRLLDDKTVSPQTVTQPFVFEDAVFPRPKIFASIGVAIGLLLGLIALAVFWNGFSWRGGRSS